MIFPDEPHVPPAQATTVTDWLRFEDVTQDGRLTLPGMHPSITIAIWRNLLTLDPWARALLAAGTVPIIARLVLGGAAPGSITPTRPVTVDGRYRLAHTRGPDGAVDRVIMGAWTRISAPEGATHGTAGPGASIVCGRAYGEHVFTRLFAAPGARRVLALSRDDGPWVPEVEVPWRTPEDVLALPADATPLDDGLVDDATPIRFGLAQTDPNAHVTALVYPRLFEEAALRRLAARGVPGLLLGRACELAFRKPSFAGDAARLALRAYRTADGAFGAVGAFYGPDDPRPRTTLALRLEP